MAKKSISVTLEETTINNLKYIAEEEMRSVSNLIDYIVAQYAKNHPLTASAKLDMAIEFGNNISIDTYPETFKTLLHNVTIDDEDREYLSKAGKKDI